MGAYVTTTSISILLPNYLKGNTTTSDTAGTAAFGYHATRAEGVVNSYLTQLYSLPFASVPQIIKTIAEDLTCYFAIRAAQTPDGQSKNPFYESYKTGIETLEKVRDGVVKLTDDSGNVIAVKATNRFLSSTDGYTPIFNLDDPKNWSLDKDQEDQIVSERD